jgi:hypothetical protein
MKSTRLATIFSLLLIGLTNIVSAQETQKPLTDAEMTQKLVGTWKANSKSPSGILSANGTYTIFSDGRFETTGTIVNNAGTKVTSLTFKGEWQVQAGVYIETVRKTSNSALMPVGRVSRHKIIQVDEKQWIYIHKGKTVTQERLE